MTALDGLLAQVIRASIPLPLSGTGSRQSSLSCNKNTVMRVQRLVDKPLRDLWPVGVRGADEIDLKLAEALESPDSV